MSCHSERFECDARVAEPARQSWFSGRGTGGKCGRIDSMTWVSKSGGSTGSAVGLGSTAGVECTFLSARAGARPVALGATAVATSCPDGIKAGVRTAGASATSTGAPPTEGAEVGTGAVSGFVVRETGAVDVVACGRGRGGVVSCHTRPPIKPKAAIVAATQKIPRKGFENAARLFIFSASTGTCLLGKYGLGVGVGTARRTDLLQRPDSLLPTSQARMPVASTGGWAGCTGPNKSGRWGGRGLIPKIDFDVAGEPSLASCSIFCALWGSA